MKQYLFIKVNKKVSKYSESKSEQANGQELVMINSAITFIFLFFCKARK